MVERTPDVSSKALITKETPAVMNPAASKERVAKQYTIEQFMATTRVGGASFSPDETVDPVPQQQERDLTMSTASPVSGGEPKQLTNSTKESTYLVSGLPKDARFIYSYDKGGNENSHLYLRELDGTERDLTPGDKTKANFLKWSQDRKSFFFSTNARDPKFFDIFEMRSRRQ